MSGEGARPGKAGESAPSLAPEESQWTPPPPLVWPSLPAAALLAAAASAAAATLAAAAAGSLVPLGAELRLARALAEVAVVIAPVRRARGAGRSVPALAEALGEAEARLLLSAGDGERRRPPAAAAAAARRLCCAQRRRHRRAAPLPRRFALPLAAASRRRVAGRAGPVELDLRPATQIDGDPVPFFTGEKSLGIVAGYDTDLRLILKSTSPTPATVLAIAPELEVTA